MMDFVQNYLLYENNRHVSTINLCLLVAGSRKAFVCMSLSLAARRL